MLVVDPNKRFSLWQVKRHRWMQAEAPAESMEEQDVAAKETANEQILRLMQSLGVDPAKTKEALDHERYDHYAAIYYLLLERRSHLTQATTTSHLTDAVAAASSAAAAACAAAAAAVAPRKSTVNNELSTTYLDHTVIYSFNMTIISINSMPIHPEIPDVLFIKAS